MSEQRNKLALGLAPDLVLARILKNVGEDGEEVVDVLEKDGEDLRVRGRRLEQGKDGAEDDAVLDEVVLGAQRGERKVSWVKMEAGKEGRRRRRRSGTDLERKRIEEDGKDLVERNDVGILEDDPSDGSGGVVLSGADGGGVRLLDEEERSKDGEELDDVVEPELCVHVLDENTGGKGGIRADLGFIVGESEIDELEEGLGKSDVEGGQRQLRRDERESHWRTHRDVRSHASL